MLADLHQQENNPARVAAGRVTHLFLDTERLHLGLAMAPFSQVIPLSRDISEGAVA